MKRDIKDYIGNKNTVILCKTQEQCDKITEMLGYQLVSTWLMYEGETCIWLDSQCLDRLEFCIEENCIIIPASDFLQYTKSSLDDPNLPELVRRYLTTISVLCNNVPKADMIIKYLTEEDSHIPLQEFLLNNSKIDWAMGINLLDAVDLIVENKE